MCSLENNIKEDLLYRIPTERSSYSTLKQQEYGFFFMEGVVGSMVCCQQSKVTWKEKLETDVEIFKMHFSLHKNDFPIRIYNSFNFVSFCFFYTLKL